jgi:hypothetical protein
LKQNCGLPHKCPHNRLSEIDESNPMNKEEVLAVIENCNSNADCADIQKVARDRGAAIRSAAYKAQVDEYWKRAIFFREGETLYCAAAGTFIGRPLQRGDKCTVHQVEAGR